MVENLMLDIHLKYVIHTTNFDERKKPYVL